MTAPATDHQKGTVVTVSAGLQLLADLPDNPTPRQRAEVLTFVRAYAPALHQLAMDEVARQQLRGRLDDDAFRAAAAALAGADPREWVEQLPLVRRLARHEPRHRVLVRRLCRWNR